MMEEKTPKATYNLARVFFQNPAIILTANSKPRFSISVTNLGTFLVYFNKPRK